LIGTGVRRLATGDFVRYAALHLGEDLFDRAAFLLGSGLG
jgi:hypothetical protein